MGIQTAKNLLASAVEMEKELNDRLRELNGEIAGLSSLLENKRAEALRTEGALLAIAEMKKRAEGGK
jgi:hypothetical protein